jgi:hypothetical protein
MSVTSKAKVFFIAGLSILVGFTRNARADYESKPINADNYHLELNFNPHQYGDALEVGIGTPLFFKFGEKSRHHWGLFTTLGANFLYNADLDGHRESSQILDPEWMVGLFANSRFKDDFINQYGKIAISTVFYDRDLRSSPGIGGLIQTGLEFRGDFGISEWSGVKNPMTVHLGVRWRFGFPRAKGLQNDGNPVDGVSFVSGTYFYF